VTERRRDVLGRFVSNERMWADGDGPVRCVVSDDAAGLLEWIEQHHPGLINSNEGGTP
jgi:hypothetical protein